MADLYCVRCGKPIPRLGRLKPCVYCGGLEFTTRGDFDRALTENDRRFLRSIRVASKHDLKDDKERI